MRRTCSEGEASPYRENPATTQVAMGRSHHTASVKPRAAVPGAIREGHPPRRVGTVTVKSLEFKVKICVI